MTTPAVPPTEPNHGPEHDTLPPPVDAWADAAEALAEDDQREP